MGIYPLMDRSLWTLYAVIAILVIVIIILSILLSRGGMTAENAALIKSVEAMRAQNSAEHGSIEGTGKHTNSMVGRMLERLRFLK